MNTFDTNSGLIYTDNDYKIADGAERQTIINPATLKKEGEIALCQQHEADIVVAKANVAQKQWKDVDAKSRAAILHDLAHRIETSDLTEVAKQMTLEMGKPFPEAMGELANVAPIFRYYAEMARDDAGHVAGTTQKGSFQYARKEPYGVSVHIMPFNFPILLTCWTLAASLASGNTCIVKPAETTSLCTLRFMELFNELPSNLVQCVTGGVDIAQALIRHKNTHIVAFTGGVEAGKKVNMACAEQFKPCIIEAGGNDSMIISKHAPLEVAVAGSVCAAFHLSGQICTSAERFFVHEDIHDEFVARFVEATRALRIGNGLGQSEMGPLVSEAARAKVQRLIGNAIEKGAKVATGGKIPKGLDTGWFYEPTILTNVTPDMEIMQSEVFGPVASICKVSSVDEALRLANESEFGLGSSIFTTDLKEAMQAAEEYQTGMVWVNNPLIDNDALPFGGWKMSGQGRELGRQGLDAFRQSKMVIIDHDPIVHDWWYPYDNEVFYSQDA
ncbi:MAG: aldehyde dehydrogenase [Gammaproteobacteria bacterium]|nr:aldehyde dehydrogenase [Gammaproteobacteria bacterium]